MRPQNHLTVELCINQRLRYTRGVGVSFLLLLKNSVFEYRLPHKTSAFEYRTTFAIGVIAMAIRENYAHGLGDLIEV